MYKILKPIPGYAYFGGELVRALPKGEASRLLNAGYLVILPETEGEDDYVCEMPEDMPYREILISNGYVSLDDLPKSAKALASAIKEITPKRAEAIYNYLKKSRSWK